MWVITILIIIACFICLCFLFKHDSEFHDDKTGRWYKYVKKTDNPHHRLCPKCFPYGWASSGTKQVSPLIYSTNEGKRHTGVDCKKCGIVWLDLECKEEK